MFIFSPSCSRGASSGDVRRMERDAAPAGAGITYPPHSGDPGAPPVRYYGRTARSSLTEARLPASRGFRPGFPQGSSAQEPTEPPIAPRSAAWGRKQNAAVERREARALTKARGTPDHLLAGRLVPSVHVKAPFGAPPPLAFEGRKLQGVPGAFQTIR